MSVGAIQRSASRLLAGLCLSQRITIPASNNNAIALLSSSGRRQIATKEAQQLQEAALEENCILVDEHDRSIGYGSKRDCHRVGPDGQIKLHRAFSVFLFNSAGDMLLQKRSSHKVSVVFFVLVVERDTSRRERCVSF